MTESDYIPPGPNRADHFDWEELFSRAEAINHELDEIEKLVKGGCDTKSLPDTRQ